MSSFADYFSGAAVRYASHRPHYPPALMDWLAGVASSRDVAWDCGTGNGQAAMGLARHFRTVLASDPSQAQLRYATRASGVEYAAMTAESAAIRAGCVNLVTVAQALHWFDLLRFYTEVDRVLDRDGVLAVWMYGLLQVDSAIDERIGHFNRDVVGGYWPKERALVEQGYAGIDFPFREVQVPPMVMEAHWTLGQVGAYLDTWSAVTRYRQAVGGNPVGRFITSISRLWGDADTARRVTWPLEVRVGRKR
ncbi:MAG: class I SAM-dependent methyltransferase [Gemmatimonadaceae bacterium]